MSDVISKEHADKIKINIRETLDINFWCDELGLRAEELKEIVQTVGPSVHEVRVHLAKNLLVKWPLAY